MRMNGNSKEKMDMTFHVKIEVQGVTENSVTIDKPEYHLVVVDGKIKELMPLKY